MNWVTFKPQKAIPANLYIMITFYNKKEDVFEEDRNKPKNLKNWPSYARFQSYE